MATVLNFELNISKVHLFIFYCLLLWSLPIIIKFPVANEKHFIPLADWLFKVHK